MSNTFTSQILKDDTQHVVIKLTGKFDGTGQILFLEHWQQIDIQL